MERFSLYPNEIQFSGDQLWKILIHCDNCENEINSTTCFLCIFKIYSDHKKEKEKNINEIVFGLNRSFSPEELHLISITYIFFCKLSSLHFVQHCAVNLTKCKLNKIFPITSLTDSILDILSLTKSCHQSSLNDKIRHDSSIICLHCWKKTLHRIRKLQNIYEKSQLAQYLKNKFGSASFSLGFFLTLFPTLNKIEFQQCKSAIFPSHTEMEYNYFNNTFIATISHSDQNVRRWYRFGMNLPKKLSNKLLFFKHFFRSKLYDFDFKDFRNLEAKIIQLKHQMQILLRSFFDDIEDQYVNNIAINLAIEFLQIATLFPLLVDSFIEEIFIDSKDGFIYINHQNYGRCETEYRLGEEEFEALQNHLRLESGSRLDETHPHLMYVINNNLFHCRFAIDIYPSHWKDISIDIRNLRKNTITIFDLLKFQTLNLEMACFLLFCVIYRINITIAGEVNSGKTTLLNALDLFIPNNFRKIYIEETIESLELPCTENHQLKFRIEPETQNNQAKEEMIYQLLHRTGDTIILGEILSKNETRALFHCLSAGLKGLQTTHALNLDGLLNRWIVHYDIEKTCLNDLGILILMRKVGERRIVYSINEINYDIKTNKIHATTFFEFIPQENCWKQDQPLHSSNFYKDISRLTYISDEKLCLILDCIKNELLTAIQHDNSISISQINLNIIQKLKKIDISVGVA